MELVGMAVRVSYQGIIQLQNTGFHDKIPGKGFQKRFQISDFFPEGKSRKKINHVKIHIFGSIDSGNVST